MMQGLTNASVKNNGRNTTDLRDVELLAEVGIHDQLLRCAAAAAVVAAGTPRRGNDQELVAEVREGLEPRAAAQRRPDADAVAHLHRGHESGGEQCAASWDAPSVTDQRGIRTGCSNTMASFGNDGMRCLLQILACPGCREGWMRRDGQPQTGCR